MSKRISAAGLLQCISLLFALRHAQRRLSRISAMEPQHRALRVLGDKRARDVKATAQTKNRCCVFGDLSYRHCNRRNRYIDSSKTRTNTTVTVARGAPALAPAARAKHGLIEVKELS